MPTSRGALCYSVVVTLLVTALYVFSGVVGTASSALDSYIGGYRKPRCLSRHFRSEGIGGGGASLSAPVRGGHWREVPALDTCECVSSNGSSW